MTLDEIVAELVAAHAAGLDVARLHSGDPSVFSAMAEQLRRLDAAGVPYDVTPGVPAFAAAAASLRRSSRTGVGQTVVLTRTAARATPMPEGEDLDTLGRSQATLVLHLAVQRLDELVGELVPNYGVDCPVAVVADVTQRRDPGPPSRHFADQVRAAGIVRTAVIVVGRVLPRQSSPTATCTRRPGVGTDVWFAVAGAVARRDRRGEAAGRGAGGRAVGGGDLVAGGSGP